MISGPIRVAAGAVGRLSAIILFVAFLTFTFNFLGTILCAVAIGVMMGGTKHARWQAVPVSVVFPAVVFVMLRSARTELVREQINGLSVLCFGAFWLTYGMTVLVGAVEKKEARGARVTGIQAATDAPLEGNAFARKEVVGELSVEALQGHWECEANQERHLARRELEITDRRVAIRAFDATGKLQWVAKGSLRLEHWGPTTRLLLSRNGGNGSAELEPRTAESRGQTNRVRQA